MVMRSRQAFLRDPSQNWDQLETRVKEHLNWEPGAPWSVEEYGRRFRWGSYRTLKRMFFVLARLHRSLRENDVALTKGLVAQAMKMVTQTVCDQGSFSASWTVMPFEDPALASATPDANPPSPEHMDLSAGLMEPHQMMASLGHVEDQVNLAKARTERVIKQSLMLKAPEAAAVQKGARRPRGGGRRSRRKGQEGAE